jgi:archaellum component FlaF (FlaF/FlaG flagellin family)
MNLIHARQRRALATVITSAIMMSAVTLMGSACIVWSQSSLTTQQAEMTNNVSDYLSKLNESLVFEYVYCTSDPCTQINLVLTNVGQVGVNISEITISEKTSGFVKIYSILDGEIMPENSLKITLTNNAFSSYEILDVVVKTERGNTVMTQTNT